MLRSFCEESNYLRSPNRALLPPPAKDLHFHAFSAFSGVSINSKSFQLRFAAPAVTEFRLFVSCCTSQWRQEDAAPPHNGQPTFLSSSRCQRKGVQLNGHWFLRSAGQEEKGPERNSKEIANIHSILSVLQMRKIIFQ